MTINVLSLSALANSTAADPASTNITSHASATDSLYFEVGWDATNGSYSLTSCVLNSVAMTEVEDRAIVGDAPCVICASRALVVPTEQGVSLPIDTARGAAAVDGGGRFVVWISATGTLTIRAHSTDAKEGTATASTSVSSQTTDTVLGVGWSYNGGGGTNPNAALTGQTVVTGMDNTSNYNNYAADVFTVNSPGASSTTGSVDGYYAGLVLLSLYETTAASPIPSAARRNLLCNSIYRR